MLKYISASNIFCWDLFAILGMSKNFIFSYVWLKEKYTFFFFFEILAVIAERFSEARNKKARES